MMSLITSVIAITLIGIIGGKAQVITTSTRAPTTTAAQESEVVFANVVFRHGDRAPDDNGMEMYPLDPYKDDKFPPMGLGGLTNNGKNREYTLGVTLRTRYDALLGQIYVPDDVEARSTDYRRTKMSLSLVLAGLYPPSSDQQWNRNLNWQPIPTTYQPRALDVLLIPEECPLYLAERDSVEKSAEVRSQVEEFSDFMNILSEKTGLNVTNTNQIYYLYHTLMAERSANKKLPEWTLQYFPSGRILDGTVLEYNIMSYNRNLKRLNGGTLLKRFIDDMKLKKEGRSPAAQKLNLFSGHETNVAAVLQVLGLYQPHAPEYSSAVFVELHKRGSDYFVKVVYYKGIPSEVEELEIPGCASPCSFDAFERLYEEYMPSAEELRCRKSGQAILPS